MNKKKKIIAFWIAGMCLSLGVQAQEGYRDLNKNGRMDPYENPALPADERAADLLSRMTLDEKAGAMFHTYSMLTKDGSMDEKAAITGGLTTGELIQENRMNHFNLVGDAPATSIARYINKMQKMAENTRLGIPVTFSTDPRSSYKESDMSTTVSAGDLTAFPEQLGLAATYDTDMAYRAARVMASEYRALGISMLLGPIADVATEPRWARISGTFGEDAVQASAMIAAYINGFQGDEINAQSVACITKHFPGNGPQEEGWDGHFSYGRNLVYPGDNFAYHLRPFKAAIQAETAGMMTCYGIPRGQFSAEVGSSFLKEVMTDLLKEKMGFSGIVISDWNTVTDKYIDGQRIIEVRSWGMENASVKERLQALIFAGVDQIGGETQTAPLMELVETGEIPMEIIDASVFKIMKLKFELGLFDNPYVDESKVALAVGNPANREIGTEVQQKSLILLENKGGMYPLPMGKKIYVEGYKNKEAFAQYGTVVDDIDQSDFTIIRLTTPFDPPRNMLEASFRQGSLAYKDAERDEIVTKLNQKPGVVVINLERAAVIPEVAASANVLIAEFGISNEVLAAALFGESKPQGRLPIELPSSMEAVKKQKEDVPYDSENPLYPYGFGLGGLLPLAGTYNFRDMGGVRNSEGKQIKWGKIFRSDDLKELTDEDLAYLNRIPLRSVVDFRSPAEVEQAPDKLPASASAYELPIDFGSLNTDAIKEVGMVESGQVEVFMMDLNRSFSKDPVAINQYRIFFQMLQDETKLPLVFHCSAGKDRTGMAAALFLYALGVDEEVIMEDYLSSNRYLAGKYAGLITEQPHLKPLFEVKREYLQAGIEQIRKDHGSVENYLTDVLGVDIVKLEKLYISNSHK